MLPTINECYKELVGKTLKLEENASYSFTIEGLPLIFKETHICDKDAFYLEIPTEAILEKLIKENITSCGCGHDHTESSHPFIVVFEENYDSIDDHLDFDILTIGDIDKSKTYTEVAVVRNRKLLEDYRKGHYNIWSFKKDSVISRIIKVTAKKRQALGSEFIRSRLENVEFNIEEGHVTFTWHTTPTQVETDAGGLITPTSVPTVPDISKTRSTPKGKPKIVKTIGNKKAKSGEKSNSGKGSSSLAFKKNYSINFVLEDYYTMQLRFYENEKWKTKPYKDFTKHDIETMLNEAHVKLFCSCPHFNWGAVAYNLTRVGASIQPQDSPGEHIWLNRHGKPHLLCKHLANLQSTILMQLGKMVSGIKKFAIETKIDDQYPEVSKLKKKRSY